MLRGFCAAWAYSGMAWEGAACQVSRLLPGVLPGVFVPVGVTGEGEAALLSEGSLSLADTPAGLLCSLPAPQVPH